LVAVQNLVVFFITFSTITAVYYSPLSIARVGPRLDHVSY